MAISLASENRQELIERVSSSVIVQRLPWFLIGFGVLVRLFNYFDNRSLWVDEAALALSIISRSYTELFNPLDSLTGAPVGFLAVERFFVAVLGNNEFSLRLFPLIAGLGSLFLFYAIAKQYLRPSTVNIALGFFAISPLLIRYSAELKQYSVDVLVGLILLYATTNLVRSNLNLIWIAVYGIVGAILIWFAYPSVFVLAGLGTVIWLSVAIKRDWLKVIILSIAFTLWLVSFGASYLVSSVDNLVENEGIVGFFEGSSRFMPLPPTSLSDLAWYVTTFLEVFDNPVGLSLTGVAALAFVFGCVAYYKSDRFNFFLVVSPIVAVLLVSGLKLYPFGDRWILFLVPFILILVAKGIEQVFDKTRDTYPLAGLAFAGILFFYAFISMGFNLVSPPAREEIRPVMSHLRANLSEGDIVYVYYGAEPAFRYYSEEYGFGELDYILGVNSRGIHQGYVDDLNTLSGNERVWIVMSHILKVREFSEEFLFTRHLESIGVRLESFKSPGAAIYLYDLSQSTPSTSN